MSMSMENKRKSYILFGAGYYGEEALWYYGTANVAYFCDNKKSGKSVKGIPVISFQKLCEIWKDYEVVVTALENPARSEITKQLEESGINYSFYTAQQFKIQEDNFAGEYAWMNCSRKSEKLLLVLAGYKSYLWDSVFGRLRKFVPQDFDICILTAGYKNTELAERCEKEGWSYLYSKENKPALVMNCAVKEHPNAKWIFKMDEDIFVTDGLFQELLQTYQHVEEEKKYRVGFAAPLMAVNNYGYRRILEYLDCLDEYRAQFDDAYYGNGIIYTDPFVAKYLWNKTLPIDEFAERLKKKEEKYSVCFHKFSIGCILLHRRTWEEMGGFRNAPEGILGKDEDGLCEFCMAWCRAIIIAEHAFAGHFAYGKQEEAMKEMYGRRLEEFE